MFFSGNFSGRGSFAPPLPLKKTSRFATKTPTSGGQPIDGSPKMNLRVGRLGGAEMLLVLGGVTSFN